MRLNDIHTRYKDRIQFLCVYIQEAHPEDGWQTQNNIDAGIRVIQPTNADERAELAEACMLQLDLTLPMVLDDMTNQADELYCASPERLFVIGADGKVVWRSKIGPWGFNVDAWEEEIATLAAG